MNFKRSLALIAAFISVQTGFAQTGFNFTCSRDTTIQGCGAQVCFTLKARIPDLKSNSSTYTVNPVAATGGCFSPVVSPNDPAGTSGNLTIDDRYSLNPIPLGFTFPFFGLNYTSVLATSNGYLTFDPDGNLANASAHYGILNGGGFLSASSGTPANLPNSLYHPAIIMGPYHDIDPTPSISTSPNKRIQFQTFGVAPYRRWVLSFYKIPLFSSSCNALIENTSQIVLFESTGVIEVTIFSKQNCTSWNQGRAMIGIQDHNKAVGYMAPGRKASDAPWGALNMNETWRFVPNSGTSLLKRVELLDQSGAIIATGTTTPGSNGVIPVTFPNVCVSGGSSRLVVRSVYGKYGATTTEIVNYDTVRVNAGFKSTTTLTPPTCSAPGTLVAQVPAGQGVAPFSYSLDGGAFQSSGTFTGVPSGSHTLIVKDANCSDTSLVVMPAPAGITGTAVTTPSGCTPSGSITVTPTSGTAPYTYSLDGAPYVTSNVFIAVGTGSHTVSFKDAIGCPGTVTVNVGARPALGGSAVPLPSGCTPSGTITVTPTGGTAPFTYALGSGSFVPSNVFNPVGAGTYIVTIKDSTGCTFDVTGIVVPGTSVSASAVSTPSACNPTGTVTVTATSGTAPYTYQLGSNAAQASNIFNNLATGSYVITVKDAVNCVATVNVNVGAVNPLLATTVSTPSGCNPASGTITVTATGGTAPYSYKTLGGTAQASNILTGLPSGSQTVIVSDNGGCADTLTVVIAATPAVDASAVTTASGCVPSDGTITVSVAAGTAPYSYKLDGGAAQAATLFTAVPAGAHSVVVTDAAGCSDTVLVTVARTPQPAGTAVTTLSGCVPSGSITINMTAGTAPYSYVLGSGSAQSGNSFTALAAGSYSVTVTDAKGCTVVIPATVGQYPALTATGTTTPSGCTPPTGTITITVPAGSGLAPFTYALDALAPVPGNLFTGVTAGAHTVTVTDAAGCTFPVDVVVGSPVTLTATVATTASGCIPSGTITVNMTAGIGQAPFIYVLDGGAPQAGSTFTGVAVGPHSVHVTDAAGCVADFPATVAATQPLNATVRTHAPSCDAAANGSAVLTPSTGVAPYQFRINNGPWQVSDSFPGLPAGPYSLQFQDAQGCISASFPATVAAGGPITATTIQSNVSCFGGSNGSTTLTLSANATGPFQFSTNNFTSFQASNVISGLSAGTATVSFRDALGCSNSVQVTITEPTQLVAGAPVLVNPLCNGVANGTVTLSATGGTAPYQYSFNGGAFGTAAQFTSGSGNFTATIRDANNCTVPVAAFALVDPATMQIDSVLVRPAGCDSNGRVMIFASGGTAPYQYQVGTNAFASAANQSVPAASYTVSVRDANGCAKSQSNVVVPQISTLAYVAPVVAPICEGTSATIAPVTNATGFTWTGPNVRPNNTSGSSVSVRPASDTFYILNYTLGTCSGRDSIPVTVRRAPTPDAGTATAICSGQDAQLNAAAGFTEYHWSPSTYLSNADIRNPNVVRPNASIQYSLHVVDANGCMSLVPDTVTVPVTPPIIVRVSPADTVGYIGDTLRITASAVATHFQWFNAQNVAPDNIVNPNVASALLLVEKNEVLRVHAWTDQGCAGDGYFYLRAYKGPEIYVPTAFTPNRDGRNDRLRPICVGIQQLTFFRVFNRWGQLMYEYKGEKRGPAVYNMMQSNIGWDGRQDGKELTTGAYIWIAEGLTKEGKPISRKGTVTIIQ